MIGDNRTAIRVPQTKFRRMCNAVVPLFEGLGVPVVNLLNRTHPQQSGGEAEAQCAYMNALGCIDMVVSSDVDGRIRLCCGAFIDDFHSFAVWCSGCRQEASYASESACGGDLPSQTHKRNSWSWQEPAG